MTREELIESLTILKEQAQEYGDNTFVWDININSFNFVINSAIKALEQEPCEDVISRKSIKQKLQEHHDFFVNAYGGFSNLPQNDKSRVDEITNCIAMVVNEPPVTPQAPRKGHWEHGKELGREYQGKTLVDITYEDWHCSNCHCVIEQSSKPKWSYCPSCGAKMVEPQERSKKE